MLSQTSPCFYVSALQVFRKLCGKRRNSSSRAISRFPTAFSTLLSNFFFFHSRNCCLQTLQVWNSLKFVVLEWVNSLPNVKILDLSKLKAFVDDKSMMAQMTNYVLEKVENVRKGENAD